MAAVLAALPEARLVGGCVRDFLADRGVADIDLATPSEPAETMRALAAAGLRAIPTGLAHGTVTAMSGGQTFEVTTLRRDIATDGRHAEVAFTTDWRADAARRDFTINAMSMIPDGTVFDYFGGIGDLRAGRVTFVGDPAARIAEDFLRILRFFRFWARYGRGAPDPAAVAAIAAGAPGLARLSAERIWSELRRIVAAPDPTASVYLMACTGVLEAILPGADPDRLARMVAAGAPNDPLLRVAALATEITVVARLRPSARDLEYLEAARREPPATDADSLRRALAGADHWVLESRFWLALRPPPALLNALEQPVFPLQGRDLIAAGVPPGRALGALLHDLRRWWLDGGCRADATACAAELARRLTG